MANWGGLNKHDDKLFSEWTDKYVPACDNADTLAGEIIRAINRLVYRYYNDGDTVDRFYGSVYNHSKACDNFLCEHVPGYETLRGFSEDVFGYQVNKRLKFIVDFLSNNVEYFSKPNDEDCLDNAPYEDWSEEEECDWDWDDDEFEDEDDTDW